MVFVIFFLLCVLIVILILGNNKSTKESVIADSSVFMDGRIYDIVKTNFVSFNLIIPSFVIKDLENISNSKNIVRKSRAKKALSLLGKLKKSGSGINVKVLNTQLTRTDNSSKVILKLAESIKAGILTKNFNIYKEACLRKIRILNINNLEAALYPIFMPGDRISVYLAKEGLQHNQAVGYFDEKTKIIAEDANTFIGKNVDITIISVIFTPTERIIFGKPQEQFK
ncbi:MAG: hypothetical protein LBL71_00495 [Endomicrobium sp.]|jgi:uncharacterized protein YacL|nr:hypothetical protein [Endomicrobium sp.]